MARCLTIAIDGPSAVGKSVVGRELANRLNYFFLDTGAMYRALTWLALQQNVDLNDEELLACMAREAGIAITQPTRDDGRFYSVFVGEIDITWEIRSHEVDRHVSKVSMFPRVREALVERQRRIAHKGRIVMMGRDIGTVVLPDADLKVYLDASTTERARRRYQELIDRGEPADFETIREAIVRRDTLDSEREVSPLTIPDGALVIDTTNKTIDEVVQEILDAAD